MSEKHDSFVCRHRSLVIIKTKYRWEEHMLTNGDAVTTLDKWTDKSTWKIQF